MEAGDCRPVMEAAGLYPEGAARRTESWVRLSFYEDHADSGVENAGEGQEQEAERRREVTHFKTEERGMNPRPVPLAG